MATGYGKINQTVAPIPTGGLDVIASLEQVNLDSGTLYVATELMNAFFLSIPSRDKIKSNFDLQYTFTIIALGLVNSFVLI